MEGLFKGHLAITQGKMEIIRSHNEIMVTFLLQCLSRLGFLNTNISGDMAELLQKFQENHVPLKMYDRNLSSMEISLLRREQEMSSGRTNWRRLKVIELRSGVHIVQIPP